MAGPPMALVVKRLLGGAIKIEEIPDDAHAVDVARYMHWEILARDSEIPYVKRVFEGIEPAQRNANRSGDTGE